MSTSEGQPSGSQPSGAPFTHRLQVCFGDCDPAGIAFYPSYFRWFDAAMNALMFKTFGSFQGVRERLDTIGTGLMEAGARFHSPVEPGDWLELQLRITDIQRRSFRAEYLGTCDGRKVVTGFEVRGVFRREGGRVRAGSTDTLAQAFREAGLYA
ncbi:MAG: acyl-CoA thioesterase [Myxococcota bacterium]|nr:acyl-CoA thioesterase [Myxococcota bacterium]